VTPTGANVANEERNVEREVIVDSFEQSQTEFREAIGDLATAARRQIDPAERIGERAWPWLVGSFALGLWIGFRAGRCSSQGTWSSSR